MLLRIELGSHYYFVLQRRSTFMENRLVGAPRIELGPRVPKTRILPIYYAPTKRFSPKHVLVPNGATRDESFATARKSCELSGCRELNPGLTHPMGKYYRCTTARSSERNTNISHFVFPNVAGSKISYSLLASTQENISYYFLESSAAG